MFTTNLIQYETTGNIGICPKCGGQLTIEKMKLSDRENAQITCQRCGKSEYYTGTIEKD